MTNSVLSVIIPNYNSAKQLIRTLKSYESILSNRCNEVEFIIIDDNSSDDSYNVLTDFSETSTLKIIVLKNEINEGPGPSRNKGINACNSSYLTFMDADDSFSNDFFEKIISVLKLNNYDCVLFNFYLVHNGKKKKKNQFLCKHLDEEPVDIITYCKGAPWGKVFRKSIVVNNKIVFLKQMQAEDVGFVKVALSNCQSFYLLSDHLYNYYVADKSLMRTEKHINPNNHVNAFFYIKDNINPKYDFLLEPIYYIEVIYDAGRLCSTVQNGSMWSNTIDNILSTYPCCFNKQYIKKLSFARKLLLWAIVRKKYKLVKFLSSF